ncbi:type II secretion system secretin GspD [Pseudoxanthomonas helianthi]|uniref:Type II secretion system secretin GspD n=2 Tax=Pseudoxanthomonas helianthi TaxID=1453541 RepID=A0A941AWK3_9GAMM|nr:type II secretion system secretin GspD [Pseudoxanthomonas helianthi]MBP3984468.1 type II secretion system secretin GspD [Pseudoxanthomonas helianthi]
MSAAMKSPLLPLFALIGLLAGCASVPTPDVHRGAAGTQGDTASTGAQTSALQSPEEPLTGPKAQIRRGNGQMINRAAASAPPPSFAGASSGSASFNFEGTPVQAVVKGILGDLLGQNYVIDPKVTGTITLGTPKPVSPAQAFTLLDQALAQVNARMVYADGRYSIVPADAALAGNVAPRSGPAGNARGYEVRVVPLRFISASEMEKILKPYARPNAIVGIDSSRNLITVAGTRGELENYLRTVEIFDVDWLSGMSVGVFPLQNGRASKVVQDLEKVFGEQSKTPSAGMFRFMPLEGANAVLVITPQAAYLDDIQDWLERIDSAGDGGRLYSYELKYIQAKELAERLAEVFGGGSAGGADSPANGQTSLMPGTEPVQINDGGMDGNASVDFGNSNGTTGGGNGSLGNGGLQLDQRKGGNASVTLDVGGDKVGVAAVEENNSILVRASPSTWKSIREVIDKLDVMPLQVHIEAQIAQVSLDGELSYGVEWYFGAGALQRGFPVDEAGLPSRFHSLGAVVGAPATSTLPAVPGASWALIKSGAAAVINALDSVTNVRMLATPSIYVRNNAVGNLLVGERIPVNSVTFNPNGNNNTGYSQVQYLETGNILKVRPRVAKDGTVFMEIVQEISAPRGEADINGNVAISTQKVKTEAAIPEGQTIMLAGLINDSVTNRTSGLPGLSRIPIIGGLFGKKGQSSNRTETIILITPTIVRNPQEARDLTDEYSRKFRAMEPLYAPKKK